jgi:dienelactone hydrolase
LYRWTSLVVVRTTPAVSPSMTGVNWSSSAVTVTVLRTWIMPAWWQADGCWHLAYLAMPEPYGGDAVYDVAVSAAAAEHRDLTAGMAVCPTELAQVADGPPLALFADGLDTAIYRLDPDLLRFGCVSAPDGPFPLITLVHGGPDARYADQFMLAPHSPGQWLATAGYAVFLPNPRGGVGHGRDFAATVARSVGGSEWSDIISGIDLLIAEGIADPDRLGIGGASHGGFMAAWAIGQTDRFKAAMMAAGISDWGMLVATGEGGTLEAELSGSCGWEGTGPHPHDQVSPISFASKIRTPVLIVHGEDDTNVPVSQAIYLRRALSWYGAEHELVIYPREGHGFASAITSSTCSGARVHGSTGGFAMKRPMAEDHRLDQRAPRPALLTQDSRPRSMAAAANGHTWKPPRLEPAG